MRLVVLCAVLLAGIAAFALWPVDEEERVKDAVRDAVRAASDGYVSDVLDAIHPDFTDRSAGRVIDRDMIRVAMLGAFGRRDRSTWFAELTAEDVGLLEFDAEAGRATAGFTVRTFRLPAGSEYVDDAEPTWVVAIEGRLLRDAEDDTWRFVSSTHETLSGRPPYR